MREIIRKIFFLLPKGDPFKVAILFVLMMIAAGLEVVGIGMIPAFVSIVAAPEQVLGYAPIQGLLSTLNISDAQDLLIWGSVALVGIFYWSQRRVKTLHFQCRTLVLRKI